MAHRHKGHRGREEVDIYLDRGTENDNTEGTDNDNTEGTENDNTESTEKVNMEDTKTKNQLSVHIGLGGQLKGEPGRHSLRV